MGRIQKSNDKKAVLCLNIFGYLKDSNTKM